MIAQGDVWWADVGDPVGSAPGYRRPVVVVQGGSITRSGIATVVCVPLTSNLGWADAPTCLLLSARSTGLAKDSVAQTNNITTLDRTQLIERIGRISPAQLSKLFDCLDIALGR